MLANQLAVQMYTIRDFTKTADDLAQSLQKVRTMGYEAVQVSAVGAMSGDTPAVSAAWAKQMLDDNGLRCIGTHRNWDDFIADPQSEIEFHKTLGCGYAAIGMLPRRYIEWGADGFRQFVSDAAPVVERLKAEGIRWGYHNHDFEFARSGVDSETLYDIFIREGGEDFKLEIDLYWAIHAGVSPERILERCAGRVPVVHLKDKEVVPGQGPIMAAIGEGNMDWPHILAAGTKAGVEVFCVEQDVCPRDPFDCLRSSFAYLTALQVA